MLQQTVVATVIPYFERFISLWPDVKTLAATPREAVLAEWAGLGYYARARNLHKCARIVAEEFDGAFPETEEALRQLPGIGAYTAGAIAAIAFNQRAAAVDGNVERVIARLCAIETPLPAAKTDIRAETEALIPTDRPGDFAQAMMDLGATICRPKAPDCLLCPWRELCRGREFAERLPVKAAKKAKPVRLGVAFAHFDGEGCVLVETRPDKGLLGGMIGLPGTDWTEAGPDDAAIAAAAPGDSVWRTSPVAARHTFTHFHLVLTVQTATGRRGAGRYLPIEDARAAAPTIMRKAMDAALQGSGDKAPD